MLRAVMHQTAGISCLLFRSGPDGSSAFFADERCHFLCHGLYLYLLIQRQYVRQFLHSLPLI